MKPSFHEKLHVNKKPAFYLVECGDICKVALVVTRVTPFFLVEVTPHKVLCTFHVGSTVKISLDILY
jgi:hypothetical protein